MDKLVLIFILPLGVLLLIGAIPSIILFLFNRFDYDDTEAGRHQRSFRRRKIIRLFMFATTLMYPAVSSQILSFFICHEINGRQFLTVDFTLECGSDRWNRHLPLAVIGILVYPIGVP